ncbi:TlpA disulfide reductase family protein [Polaromonas sp.]|uniref:TlpA family protein disulfide reductase n=1 Tax=Polaromonas sp. TaxID=1869339 RepID=UPI00286CCD46|nr:TlpA disulfide reductase family protein [Polaromonas sp.]
MKRRTMVYGGVAAAAGLAGAGVAWWKSRASAAQMPQLASQAGPPLAADAGDDAEVAKAFWALAFDTPDGKKLAMSSFQGKPLLVNFWATWCPPCIEELPLLDYFYQENKGKSWQVVGLAVDQPSAVRTWLQTRPLNFPVGMAGLSGTELSKSLGNLQGGLPFTVVFDAAGKLRERKIGKILPEELAKWVQMK